MERMFKTILSSFRQWMTQKRPEFDFEVERLVWPAHCTLMTLDSSDSSEQPCLGCFALRFSIHSLKPVPRNWVKRIQPIMRPILDSSTYLDHISPVNALLVEAIEQIARSIIIGEVRTAVIRHRLRRLSWIHCIPCRCHDKTPIALYSL